MRVLITGNMGFVGSVLTRWLRETLPRSELIGFDTGYFAHVLAGDAALPETQIDAQYFGDLRQFPDTLLSGVDAVVHLAALSNDPLGNSFEQSTHDINCAATLRLALLAEKHGVKSFVFASTCSVYGSGEDAPRSERDAVNPLTAYAQSKIAAEYGLERQSGAMTVTCMRFATACGMSQRLRLDLVLNDFVACAVALGEITVLSDGTPWRPLIDVEDMARAIEWAIARPAEHGGRFLVANVGADDRNYCIGDLAEEVSAAVAGTRVSLNRRAQPDRRSYKVDFGLFAALAPNHLPRLHLAHSIGRLRDGLQGMGFADPDFRNSRFVRLKVLEDHRRAGRLLPDLRWAPTQARA